MAGDGQRPGQGGASQAELRQRVVFALLSPAVRMAARFGVHQRDWLDWAQVAYFAHLRHQGATLKEAADAMGVSERTAKRLSREHKTHFLQPELEHNLPVRIEFMLRAESMSAARLAQVLRELPPETVSRALDQLIEEGRVVPQEGRTTTFRVVRSVSSLVRDHWLARLGGLNSLLENLTDAVRGRFFDQDGRSFARTMSFHLAPERFEALERAFEGLVDEIARLDAEAEGTPDAVPVRLSFLYAPWWARVEDPSTPPSDDP